MNADVGGSIHLSAATAPTLTTMQLTNVSASKRNVRDQSGGRAFGKRVLGEAKANVS